MGGFQAIAMVEMVEIEAFRPFMFIGNSDVSCSGMPEAHRLMTFCPVRLTKGKLKLKGNLTCQCGRRHSTPQLYIVHLTPPPPDSRSNLENMYNNEGNRQSVLRCERCQKPFDKRE